jgi:hypothetical protein
MLAIGETMSITKLHEHFSKTPPTRNQKRIMSRRYLLGNLVALVENVIM